jgi:hypothetical protein
VQAAWQGWIQRQFAEHTVENALDEVLKTSTTLQRKMKIKFLCQAVDNVKRNVVVASWEQTGVLRALFGLETKRMVVYDAIAKEPLHQTTQVDEWDPPALPDGEGEPIRQPAGTVIYVHNVPEAIPAGTQPQVNQPQVNQPQVNQPQANQPQVNQPRVLDYVLVPKLGRPPNPEPRPRPKRPVMTPFRRTLLREGQRKRFREMEETLD